MHGPTVPRASLQWMHLPPRYSSGMFTIGMDILAGFLIAYHWRPFAVVLGFMAGALISAVVAIGEGHALLIPATVSLARAMELDLIIGHATFCALFAWFCRGLLNRSIQRWWRTF